MQTHKDLNSSITGRDIKLDAALEELPDSFKLIESDINKAFHILETEGEAQALQEFQRLQLKYSDLPEVLEYRIVLGIARTKNSLGQYRDVSVLLTDLDLESTPRELVSQILFEKFLSYQGLGDAVNALIAYSQIATQEHEIFDMVDQLSLEAAMSLSESAQKLPPNVQAYLSKHISLKFLAGGEPESAINYLKGALRVVELPLLRDDIEGLLDGLKKRRRSNWRHIAILAPLGGKHVAISKNILEGFFQGLGDSHPFEVRIIDTSVSEKDYTEELESYIEFEHPLVIVGAPVGKVSRVVSKIASIKGVPFISFALSKDIKSAFVFQNALTVEHQIQELLTYLHDVHPEAGFGILYPNDRFGTYAANIFWDSLELLNKEVLAAQVYPKKNPSFSDELKRLVGTYYLKDRVAEYRENMKAWLSSYLADNPDKLRRTPIPDLLKPIINFQFLFLPDGLDALVQVAPSLSYEGVEGVTLIGTHLWNSSSQAKIAKGNINGVVFPAPYYYKEFVETPFYKEYLRLYGTKPKVMAAESHDAGLLLRSLVLDKGVRNGTDFIKSLQNVTDFSASVGPISVGDDHVIKRPVKILTVHENKIVPYEKVLESQQ